MVSQLRNSSTLLTREFADVWPGPTLTEIPSMALTAVNASSSVTSSPAKKEAGL